MAKFAPGRRVNGPFVRRLLRLAACWLATWIAPGSCVLAAPTGELDATFGTNGRVRLESDPDRHWGIGRALAEQSSDGKLILVGEEAFEGTFLVQRLNRDGSLDLSFGDGGTVTVDFGRPYASATAVALQPDGRIVVAGLADGSYGVPPIGAVMFLADVGLIRLNVDGTLDPSFGDGGSVIVDFGGGRDYLSDLVLLPTGELVVAGFTDAYGDFDAVFARLTANGELDATFGSGPAAGVTIVRASGSHDLAHAVVRRTDGSLIACGETSLAGGSPAPKVMSAARVFADGTIDMGFGAAGMARIDTGPAPSSARDCLDMPDGTLLLAGYSGTSGAEDLHLAWLGTDGRLATQHGEGGLVSIDLGASESIQGLTNLQDGSIAATGLTGTLRRYLYGGLMPMWVSEFPSTMPSEMLFAKLDRYTGRLDDAFGANGVTLVDFGRRHEASWAYGRALIQTTEGKLVAIGTAMDDAQGSQSGSPDIALARVDLSGAGNAGFVGFAATTIGTRGMAGAVAQVRRTGGSVSSIMVDYRTVADTASAPRDFTAKNGTLVWGDGELDAKTIEIPIDTRTGLDGSFSIVLDNATGTLAASELIVDLGKKPTTRPNLAYFDSDLPNLDYVVSDPALPVTAKASGGGGALGIDTWLLLALLASLRQIERIWRRRQ